MIPSFGLNCNSVNLTVNLPYTDIIWTTTNGLLIDGNPSPYTTYGNTVTISASAPGNIGTVSAASINPCDRSINPYNFNGCTLWDNTYGEPTLLITWSAPVRGEPLQAHINPMPDWNSSIVYHWFINGNFITSDNWPGFGSYDWPCNNSNGGTLSVIAVIDNSASTPALSSDYAPTCTGARIANNNNHEINIFPNPASSLVTIKFNDILLNNNLRLNKETSSKNNSVIQIKIIDKFGVVKKVFTKSASEKTITLNVSDLPTDIYYIELSNGVTKNRMPLNVIR